jgi:uncharacterized protein (TIGR02996 family)
MSEEAAFIAALVKEPTDRTAALVFADWLDERGDLRGSMMRIDEVRAWMAPRYTNPLPSLLAALESGKRIMEATKVLALIGEAAVPALVTLLSHKATLVRIRALKALRLMGQRAKPALPVVLGLIKDTDRAVRDEAARAAKDIGLVGLKDKSVLSEALHDKDAGVRYHAASLLGSMRAKKAVKDELAKGLDSKDAAERLAAVKAIETLRTRSAVGTLCKALADPDLMIRRSAVNQLDRAASPTMTAAVDPLRKVLGDTDEYMRAQAANVLGKIGPAAIPALPDLMGCLKGYTSNERVRVVEAIGRIGIGRPEALEVLLSALRDPDPQVQNAAGRTLPKWTTLPASAAAAILEFMRTAQNVANTATGLKNTAQIARHNTMWCLQALTRITPLPPEVVAEFWTRLANKDDCTTPSVVAGMGERASVLLPKLISAFHPNSGYGVADIAKALAKIGGEGIATLVRALDHPPVEGRYPYSFAITAAGALKEAGPAALPLLPELLARIRKPTNTSLQAQLVNVIAAMGPGAESAVPDLIAILHTTQEQHLSHTVFAGLHKFGPAVVPFVPQLVALLKQRPQAPESHEDILGLLVDLIPHGVDVLNLFREVLRSAIAGDLYEGLGHRPLWVARAAIRGLAVLGSAATVAIPDLTLAYQTFSTRERGELRHEVIAAYGKIGVAALPQIHPALSVPDKHIRLAALDALSATGDASQDTVDAIRTAETDAAIKVRKRALKLSKKLAAMKEKQEKKRKKEKNK